MATKEAVIFSLQLHQQFVPKLLSDHIEGSNSQCSSSYTWLYMRLKCQGQIWGLIVRFPLFLSQWYPPFSLSLLHQLQYKRTVLVMGDRQGVCLAVTPEKRILKLCGINSSKGDYLQSDISSKLPFQGCFFFIFFFCNNKYVVKLDAFCSAKYLSFLRNVKGVISFYFQLD